ncbi:unnamed protein product [Lactuca virosa]|uniref:Protein kinase domain-containing protein n=1 Tax=Lactuca virosa TaxID=75947 RepID=A0AAU9NFD3_9ASTR|nr:unnamed protein product [Lactuca virosa]
MSLDMACFARYSATPFFNINQTIDIRNILQGHSSNVTKFGGAIGGAGLFIFLVLWLMLQLWKKPKKTKEGEPDLDEAIKYNYKHLQSATNNFSEENLLGRGGFGKVFKADLDANNIVAVKKIEVGYTSKAKEEFENEVKLIGNIHHRNLLRLLGWSSEGSNLVLVLEYMSNGSLDGFLWGAKKGTLNWKQRYGIIFGIARGLHHLHNESHVKIIHRDIKSSNILLDHDFQPKIADFGLARFIPDDQSHLVSSRFAGTLGYTAPEYARHGILSDKVDTYSFGIVTLEIISGRRSTDMNFDRPSMDYLLEHAWTLYENKEHIKLIDETLDVSHYQKEHMMHIIEIALVCTQSPSSERPNISEVILMLTNNRSVLNRQLRRPTLVDYDRRIRIGS